jgi:3-dehydroquinate synthase
MPTVKSYGYDITIGPNSFKAISAFLSKNKYASYFILCDENTLKHCLPVLISSCPKLASADIIEIEAGESAKSLEFCAHIWQTLIENNAGKDSLLINVGGGVISDLGGFTASVYKRGVDFINIPTSLLAMADASVGGKTGINFARIKNSIGTFNQPVSVFIHPKFLYTLPERHFKNGLAEIFKIALIGHKPLWKRLSTSQWENEIESVILQSVELKNKIVLKDPFDKGPRKILNFGHTLGHAIESLFLGSSKELLHGEAIVIGMIMEAHISFQKKLLNKAEFYEVASVLSETFNIREIDNLSHDLISDLLKNDKKTSKNKLKFSLLTTIGFCKYDVGANDAQVKKAISFYNSLFK